MSRSNRGSCRSCHASPDAHTQANSTSSFRRSAGFSFSVPTESGFGGRLSIDNLSSLREVDEHQNEPERSTWKSLSINAVSPPSRLSDAVPDAVPHTVPDAAEPLLWSEPDVHLNSTNDSSEDADDEDDEDDENDEEPVILEAAAAAKPICISGTAITVSPRAIHAKGLLVTIRRRSPPPPLPLRSPARTGSSHNSKEKLPLDINNSADGSSTEPEPQTPDLTVGTSDNSSIRTLETPVMVNLRRPASVHSSQLDGDQKLFLGLVRHRSSTFNDADETWSFNAPISLYDPKELMS